MAEFRFLEPPRETKIAFKKRSVREIGSKITVFDWREGNDFWFKLLGGSKKRGFEKSRFHCSLLKRRILLAYNFNRQPGKIRKKLKETVNCSSCEKFRKLLNGHFGEPFKTVLSRATTKTKVFAGAHLDRPFLSSFCHCFNFWWKWHPSRGFPRYHAPDDTHLIDIWLFQNRISVIVDP